MGKQLCPYDLLVSDLCYVGVKAIINVACTSRDLVVWDDLPTPIAECMKLAGVNKMTFRISEPVRTACYDGVRRLIKQLLDAHYCTALSVDISAEDAAEWGLATTIRFK